MIKYEVIKKIASVTPEKPAIIDEKKTLSWNEFKTITENLIGEITSIKTLVYDRLTLYISKNSADLVLIGAAFSTIGIAFQGIDHHLSLNSLKSLMTHLKVKYIFISKEFESQFFDLGVTCNIIQIENFIATANQSKKFNDALYKKLPDRLFQSYSFTSGTTGIPKIAYRTVSFDKRRFEYLQNRYNFNTNDTHLVCLPMHHVASTGWLRLFLNLGCTAVIHNFKNTYELCETLHKNSISTTIMSPYMLRRVAENLNESNEHPFFPNLRFIITGGKNFPISTKREAIKKLGGIIYEYYGTTETGVNTLLDPQEALAYPGSVGRVFEGNKIAIVDENHQPLPLGKTGRIAIHSYMNMDKFLNSDAWFIDIFDEKYLLTSDYGYFNEKDYLFIAQRASIDKKSIFDLHGFENEILKLDFISDVFANETDSIGNININVVTKRYLPYADLKSKIEKISKRFCLNQLSVNVVPKLDYTLTGKIKLISTGTFY